MDKKVLRIGGLIAVMLGAAALYAGGANESTVAAVVGAVFVIGGLVAAIVKNNE